MMTFGLRPATGTGVGVIIGELGVELDMSDCFEVALDDQDFAVELEGDIEVAVDDQDFEVEVCTE